ncbi:hypothetical protein J5U23_01361 [Saccharolobus shibatae B12]|uniref:Uncharacterized protein n=1 Tax=Saccharolobus shibatae (strain ATCC 51178 / DSM 5389 / JCM 8931 / NBRC 15437 / B12) TaxID=523848 RepID=A0A8F5BNF3_SACSH|nr:hypothetical protein J5U23_01361 [Saccharolobus shibatae B12]
MDLMKMMTYKQLFLYRIIIIPRENYNSQRRRERPMIYEF